MSEQTQANTKEAYIDRQWSLLRRRPSVAKGDKNAVAAWMQSDEIKMLDAIASTMGMSRSEYLRASLINNLKDAEAAGISIENVTTPA